MSDIQFTPKEHELILLNAGPRVCERDGRQAQHDSDHIARTRRFPSKAEKPRIQGSIVIQVTFIPDHSRMGKCSSRHSIDLGATTR